MNRDMSKVAIVGCGAVVQDMYAPAVKSLSGVDVVAVCDLDGERARTVGAELGAPTMSFEEAVGEAGLVVVAAPPAAHFQLASRALEAGCSVLCEKPFVANANEASELVGLASGCGNSLFVGHFRRLLAPQRTARELLASGLLGAPQSVIATEGGRFSWQAKSAYTLNDPLGGVLYDTGSHLIDTVLFVIGLDERSFDLSVLAVDREPAVEPSHALRTQIRVESEDAEIDLTIGLSRYELLANVIRIKCERGTLELPAGPGGGLRIRGPAGQLSWRASDGQTTTSGAFIEQLRTITAGEGCEDLEGSRFVGVTHVLERVLAFGSQHG